MSTSARPAPPPSLFACIRFLPIRKSVCLPAPSENATRGERVRNVIGLTRKFYIPLLKMEEKKYSGKERSFFKLLFFKKIANGEVAKKIRKRFRILPFDILCLEAVWRFDSACERRGQVPKRCCRNDAPATLPRYPSAADSALVSPADCVFLGQRGVSCGSNLRLASPA